MRRGVGFGALLALLVAAGCSSSSAPDAGPVDAGPAPVDAAAGVDAAVDPPDAGPIDTGIITLHDAGSFVTCVRNCACPQGMACVEGLCRALGTPVWCCDKPGCPSGAACLDEDEAPATCPEVVDPPDAGPAADAGPGQVGDGCEQDRDCDQAMGLTCWERDEPPFVWGYCTNAGCTGGCPTGSECLTFNDAAMTTGCLLTCRADSECRPDAYCLDVPGSAFGGICLPDCRDDFFDCGPRDGSRYCDPSGRCAPSPGQSASAQIGDPCSNALQCGAGQTCLREGLWDLPGGLCAQVCRGVPEAQPCPSGTTCHDFAGLGLCFEDCFQSACPNRPGALCDRLDPSWSAPACIPQ